MTEMTENKTCDPERVLRKRRDAMEALDAYAKFLEQQSLDRLRAGLSSVGAALARGEDHEALERWRRYERAGLDQGRIGQPGRATRWLDRQPEENEIHYDVLRRGVARSMAHLGVYLDYQRERPTLDSSEAAINRRVADRMAWVARQTGRRRRHRLAVACLLVLAVAWIAF